MGKIKHQYTLPDGEKTEDFTIYAHGWANFCAPFEILTDTKLYGFNEDECSFRDVRNCNMCISIPVFIIRRINEGLKKLLS